jgi:pimeloyl-ACP methyl ester carboxylesterase
MGFRARILALGVVTIALTWVLAPMARATSSDALYLHPGRRVDVGGFRLNIVCRGAGSPAVIFDAGLEDWSPAWSKVQPIIAATTRTCSYDRAGNGWSDAGPFPRTSSEIVSELHALLAAANEKPPYILVGHSFGGYNVRLFADRYLDEVAGIVLVDSSHEDQDSIIASESPNAAAQWRAFLAGLRSCHALAVRGEIGRTARTEADCAGQFFRGLPERAFSPQLNAVLLQQARAPKQYAASLGEALMFRTVSAAQLRRARRSFGHVPLRILTGTHHFIDTPATSAAQRAREATYERGWQALQRSWLALSSNARQTLALRSGHYVQLDQPGLVIAAIREEIALGRRSASAQRRRLANVDVHHVVEGRER